MIAGSIDSTENIWDLSSSESSEDEEDMHPSDVSSAGGESTSMGLLKTADDEKAPAVGWSVQVNCGLGDDDEEAMLLVASSGDAEDCAAVAVPVEASQAPPSDPDCALGLFLRSFV